MAVSRLNNLGSRVSSRTINWRDLVERAWGSEFQAPDHRIYQFSQGHFFDSTDKGQTGIYSPFLGPKDNP